MVMAKWFLKNSENFHRSGGGVDWRGRGEKSESRGGNPKQGRFASGNAVCGTGTVKKPTCLAKAVHMRE